MNSRAGLWFGVHTQDGANQAQSPSSSQPPPAQPPQAGPSHLYKLDQQIYERYFQQVSRRDFLHSNLLLQYAKERNTTPHSLWLSFTTHIQTNNQENTLANLIEYLSINPAKSTAMPTIPESPGPYASMTNMGQPSYNYMAYQVNDSFEEPQNMAPVNKEYRIMYTREDFQKVKKEAEQEYYKKWDEEERTAGDRQKEKEEREKREERFRKLLGN